MDGFAQDDVNGTAAAEMRNACGYCEFTGFAMPPAAAMGYLNAVSGFGYTEEEFMQAGKRSFFMRQAFNIREGITRKDAYISDRIIGVPPLTEGPLAASP
jgi:aldehyde:ferredoxin oxidoreductase